MANAVVLVSDRKFLAPTIGTALAARTHISNQSVAIFILVTNSTEDELADVGRVVADKSIFLKSVPIGEIAKIKQGEFNKTHVPVATMARLWIADYLDPQYDKFLYLDGDVDITSSLDPLFRLDVPKNGFLAAPDLPMLIARDYGASARLTRDYLSGLGITNHDDYFNAGVLLVDRAGWKEISSEAWAYFKCHSDRCLYHDQSALNAVAKHRRGPLSLLWNYQSDFMAVADPRKWGLEPAIWHFTGFPKAWHAPVFPWGRDFGRSFALGASLLRETGWFDDFPDSAAIALGIEQREKLRFRLKWIYPWRRLLRARKIHWALTNSLQTIDKSVSNSEACTLEKLQHHNAI